jgi:hypothetical protein
VAAKTFNEFVKKGFFGLSKYGVAKEAWEAATKVAEEKFTAEHSFEAGHLQQIKPKMPGVQDIWKFLESKNLSSKRHLSSVIVEWFEEVYPVIARHFGH